MNGYVAQRRGRFYAVIYEGRDPVTGKERRNLAPRRHRPRRSRASPEAPRRRRTKRIDAVRSLTFGAYLTSQWLPAKKLHLATSTYRGYERNVQLPHPPDARRVSASAGCGTNRSRLYDIAAPPRRRARSLHPKTSTRSTSSSAARSPTRTAAGLVTRNVATRRPRPQATLAATRRRQSR
jgi:hypothetical protein